MLKDKSKIRDRDFSIDFLRSLSLIGILLAHSMNVPDKSNTLGLFLFSLGNGLAPIIFCFLSGYSINLSSNKTRQSVFIRGLLITIIGILLLTISNNIIMVLPALGISIALSSIFLHVQKKVNILFSLLLIFSSPFINSFITESFGPIKETYGTLSVFSMDGFIWIFFSGAYPVSEWFGWVLLGVSVYGVKEILVNKINVIIIVLVSISLSTVFMFSMSGFNNYKYSHLTTSVTEMGFLDRILIPYGHSGSWLWSMYSILMIFFFIIISVYIYENNVVARMISLISIYSLTIYVFSSIILGNIGTDTYGIRLFILTLVVVIILVIIFGRKGKDPISLVIGKITDYVELLINKLVNSNAYRANK